MRVLPRLLVAAALPLALLTTYDAQAAPSVPSAPSGSAIVAGGVVVTLSRDQVTASPGQRIRFESTIRNTGDHPLTDYVAHLNILSTDKSVYVDPEDWSPRRTQYLDELPPGGSTVLSWNVRAVTHGPLLLYVSVTSATAGTVTSSEPLDMTVGGHRVVNPGGIMPLVLWMPAGVLALLGATTLRQRRHR